MSLKPLLTTIEIQEDLQLLCQDLCQDLPEGSIFQPKDQGTTSDTVRLYSSLEHHTNQIEERMADIDNLRDKISITRAQLREL